MKKIMTLVALLSLVALASCGQDTTEKMEDTTSTGVQTNEDVENPTVNTEEENTTVNTEENVSNDANQAEDTVTPTEDTVTSTGDTMVPNGEVTTEATGSITVTQ